MALYNCQYKTWTKSFDFMSYAVIFLGTKVDIIITLNYREKLEFLLWVDLVTWFTVAWLNNFWDWVQNWSSSYRCFLSYSHHAHACIRLAIQNWMGARFVGWICTMLVAHPIGCRILCLVLAIVDGYIFFLFAAMKMCIMWLYETWVVDRIFIGFLARYVLSVWYAFND